MTNTARKSYPHKLKPGCHNLNLLNLKDSTKATLRAEADRLGQSLQEYLRRLLDAKAAELESKDA